MIFYEESGITIRQTDEEKRIINVWMFTDKINFNF